MATAREPARGNEVRRLLAQATQILAEAGVPSPAFDASELLAHVTGSTRARPVEPTLPQRRLFDDLIARRSARVPLQHLTGVAHFRYLTLRVGPGVFVPRPETELLAGWAVDRASESDKPIVVDLCTGSAAIALSVAAEVPAARVFAVELDERALGWAAANLAQHPAGGRVELRHGDMSSAFPELDGLADVVVSNPPYIPLDAYESVEVEVRDHDPALALWSGTDGLDALRVVEATAARLLRPGGRVGAEHADVQGDSAPAVFSGSGRWSEVRDHADLAGRPRFVTARLAR